MTIADLDALLRVWAEIKVKEERGGDLKWFAAERAAIYKSDGTLRNLVHLHPSSAVLKGLRFLSFTPIGDSTAELRIDPRAETKTDRTIYELINKDLEQIRLVREVAVRTELIRERSTTCSIKTSLGFEGSISPSTPIFGVSLQLALSRDSENSTQMRHRVTETREDRFPINACAQARSSIKVRVTVNKSSQTTINTQKVQIMGNVVFCCSNNIALRGHADKGFHNKWSVSIEEVFLDLVRYQHPIDLELISAADKELIERSMGAFVIENGKVNFLITQEVSDVNVTLNSVEYEASVPLSTEEPEEPIAAAPAPKKAETPAVTVGSPSADPVNPSIGTPLAAAPAPSRLEPVVTVGIPSGDPVNSLLGTPIAATPGPLSSQFTTKMCTAETPTALAFGTNIHIAGDATGNNIASPVNTVCSIM